MDNRKVKHLLIQHFGEEICLLYPKDRTKSQMVFSNKLKTTDLIENLWATAAIITASKLCMKAPNNMTFFLMIASLQPVIWLHKSWNLSKQATWDVEEVFWCIAA